MMHKKASTVPASVAAAESVDKVSRGTFLGILDKQPLKCIQASPASLDVSTISIHSVVAANDLGPVHKSSSTTKSNVLGKMSFEAN